jgi:hypothetical protein
VVPQDMGETLHSRRSTNNALRRIGRQTPPLPNRRFWVSGLLPISCHSAFYPLCFPTLAGPGDKGGGFRRYDLWKANTCRCRQGEAGSFDDCSIDQSWPEGSGKLSARTRYQIELKEAQLIRQIYAKRVISLSSSSERNTLCPPLQG